MNHTIMSAPRYFKYFAFISYSRRDEAFAKRLQHFLTGFKLPTRLCKIYPDKPKALRPIYRDKTDLGVDVLNAGIRHGLGLSRHLIVVCSENSAKPNREGKNWIDTEVREFLKLDGENRNYVIPVLLREKDGPSTRECTPPAVQELGLLAADVSDKGEERVFNDVAAKMLQLEPDELWAWWERSQRARRRRNRALGTVAAALAAYAGWYAWDYYTPHYSYYADYVEFNNLPQGIHPLTEKQIRHMHSHYRFTVQHHRLKRVENLNSAGHPILTDDYPGHETRPVAMSLDYNADTGEVTKQIYYDVHGKAAQIRNTGNHEITFHAARQEEGRVKDDGITGASFVMDEFRGSPEAQALQDKNKRIVRVNVTRDERGAVMTELYQNAFNSPTKNADGAWGCRYQRDGQGRILSVTYLDEKGNPLPDKKGIARYQYEYDKESQQIAKITYYGKDGAPIPGYKGVAQEIYEWKDGNVVKIRHANQAGEADITRGFSIIEMTYDDRGNLTERALLDIHGKPCCHIRGFASVRYTYDECGNLTGEAYFDTQGSPSLRKKAYASIRWTYDDRGNLASEAYFNIDGKPCLRKDGFASIRWIHDDRGNETEEAYFDINGNPCLCDEGCASTRWTYDDRGNKTGKAYFDINGNPCRHKHGFASIRWSYDDRGNETGEAYYDIDGTPCLCKDGYASKRRTYDDCGNQTGRAYYDIDGTPCLCKDGFASARFTYDDRGNETEEAYFDAQGNPCLIEGGYASVRWTYDARGNMTGRAYFGINGKPCLFKDGFASVRWTYDACGNKTEAAYFDVQGKPCLCPGGYASVRTTYNALGVPISRTYYDAEGKPIAEE